MDFHTNKDTVICWWSGGVTSAVACHIAIQLYGIENCLFLFIDTHNEHDDTYRFMMDCEKLYNKRIHSISAIGDNKKYSCIQDVWYDFKSLNVANGAICSSELKRAVRLDFQRKHVFKHQVFGFDQEDAKRKRPQNMKNNYPAAKAIFPLLLFMYTKGDCIRIIKNLGIEIPESYKNGFHNNNCFKTGCVQGGIGYWKKIQKEYPKKFKDMAKIEHELTDLKGKPVTCLKDGTESAKLSGNTNLFLIPHPDYPEHPHLGQKAYRKVEALPECNGFCGIQSTLFSR